MDAANQYIDHVLLPGSRFGSAFRLLGLRENCTEEEVHHRKRQLSVHFLGDQLERHFNQFLNDHLIDVSSQELLRLMVNVVVDVCSATLACVHSLQGPV